MNKDHGSRNAVKAELPPKWNSWSQIGIHCLRGSIIAFLKTFAVKGGISFFLYMISKKKSGNLEAFKRAFLGLETRRTAFGVGTFALIWKAITNSLFYTTGKHSKIHGAIAGAFAGLSILFESKENRVGYAQNVFFRSLQAGKNALKQRNYWTFPHGDSWLFCLATASIVYAYGFRPDTIPKSYYGWLVQKCRVPKASLLAMADHARLIEQAGNSNFKVDMKKWSQVFEKTKMIQSNVEHFHKVVNEKEGTMPGIPCYLYHPTSASCINHEWDLFLGVFQDLFPVYFSLTAIPLAVLNTKKLLREPLLQLKKSVTAAIRSSLFISFLITTFKSGMCSFYKMAPNRSNKSIVYPMAFIASLWIFLERKSKRVELAIFVLPKAAQSLYMILIDRGFICDLPGIEIAAASFSMSVIMSLYQLEPHNISQLLYKIMRATIGTY